MGAFWGGGGGCVGACSTAAAHGATTPGGGNAGAGGGGLGGGRAPGKVEIRGMAETLGGGGKTSLAVTMLGLAGSDTLPSAGLLGLAGLLGSVLPDWAASLLGSPAVFSGGVTGGIATSAIAAIFSGGASVAIFSGSGSASGAAVTAAAGSAVAAVTGAVAVSLAGVVADVSAAVLAEAAATAVAGVSAETAMGKAAATGAASTAADEVLDTGGGCGAVEVAFLGASVPAMEVPGWLANAGAGAVSFGNDGAALLAALFGTAPVAAAAAAAVSRSSGAEAAAGIATAALALGIAPAAAAAAACATGSKGGAGKARGGGGRGAGGGTAGGGGCTGGGGCGINAVVGFAAMRALMVRTASSAIDSASTTCSGCPLISNMHFSGVRLAQIRAPVFCITARIQLPLPRTLSAIWFGISNLIVSSPGASGRPLAA